MDFATLDRDPKAKHPVLVWEADGTRFKVRSRHASLDEVPDDVEAFAFDVPTTASSGSALNGSRFPVLDADGAPLWDGARIDFRVPTYYVNTVSGHGTFRKADEWNGVRYQSDVPLPVIEGRDGIHKGSSCDRYSAVSSFPPRGDALEGYVLLGSGIGDPFEHGRTETFVRLTSDPRDVCSPVPRTTPSP